METLDALEVFEVFDDFVEVEEDDGKGEAVERASETFGGSGSGSGSGSGGARERIILFEWGGGCYRVALLLLLFEVLEMAGLR